jgi:hypothetical protein
MEPDTGATDIATATAIPIVRPMAMALATGTLPEATGTRLIRRYMGVAPISRIVPIGALIAAHTRTALRSLTYRCYSVSGATPIVSS